MHIYGVFIHLSVYIRYIYIQMNKNAVNMHNYAYLGRFYSFECIYDTHSNKSKLLLESTEVNICAIDHLSNT